MADKLIKISCIGAESVDLDQIQPLQGNLKTIQ